MKLNFSKILNIFSNTKTKNEIKTQSNNLYKTFNITEKKFFEVWEKTILSNNSIYQDTNITLLNKSDNVNINEFITNNFRKNNFDTLPKTSTFTYTKKTVYNFWDSFLKLNNNLIKFLKDWIIIDLGNAFGSSEIKTIYEWLKKDNNNFLPKYYVWIDLNNYEYMPKINDLHYIQLQWDMFDFINILEDNSISCIIFNWLDSSIIHNKKWFNWLFKHFKRILKKWWFIIWNYDLYNLDDKILSWFEYIKVPIYSSILQKK